MNQYNVVVHYRYVVNDSVEKDFEEHSIEAESEEKASELALLTYTSRNRIPFKVELL